MSIRGMHKEMLGQHEADSLWTEIIMLLAILNHEVGFKAQHL